MAKGLELPVSLLVVIAVAVIILVGVVILIGPQLGTFGGGISLETKKTTACSEYISVGCVPACNSVDGKVDVTGDGTNDKVNVVVGYYLHKTSATDAECRTTCGCPGY